MKKRIFASGSSCRSQKASSSSMVFGVCTRRTGRSAFVSGAVCAACAAALWAVWPSASLWGISAPQKEQNSSPGLTGAPQAGQVFFAMAVILLPYAMHGPTLARMSVAVSSLMLSTLRSRRSLTHSWISPMQPLIRKALYMLRRSSSAPGARSCQ